MRGRWRTPARQQDDETLSNVGSYGKSHSGFSPCILQQHLFNGRSSHWGEDAELASRLANCSWLLAVDRVKVVPTASQSLICYHQTYCTLVLTWLHRQRFKSPFPLHRSLAFLDALCCCTYNLTINVNLAHWGCFAKQVYICWNLYVVRLLDRCSPHAGHYLTLPVLMAGVTFAVCLSVCMFRTHLRRNRWMDLDEIFRDVTDFKSAFESVGFRCFFTNLHQSDLQTRFLSDSVIQIWLLTVAGWILERSTAVCWQSDTDRYNRTCVHTSQYHSFFVAIYCK